jgi:hypothetical protein
MPGVYYDKEKKRYFCQMKVPKDLQASHGTKPFKHTFPQTVSREMAEVQSVGIRAGWIVQIDDWRRETQPDRPPTPYRELQRYDPTTRKTETLFVLAPQAPEGFDGSPVSSPPHSAESMRLAEGQVIDVTPNREVVDFEAVMELWLAERIQARNPPKPKAIQNKRARMVELFEFVGKTDMGKITAPDLKRYRNKVLKEGTAFHKLIDVRSMFKVAKRGGLITENPAADLAAGVRGENPTPPFSDDEARRVLVAARTAENPAVRWGHWLAAFTTGMNSELLQAQASEFYQIESGRWVWDSRGRTLKTECRPRIVALHTAIIREGFLDYLATRKGKPLFDGSYNVNDQALRDLIHGLGIDKGFYAWRKRTGHLIAKAAGESLGCYIEGHAAKGIAGKFYRFHELPEAFGDIVKAIDSLIDPTVPRAAQAAA